MSIHLKQRILVVMEHMFGRLFHGSALWLVGLVVFVVVFNVLFHRTQGTARIIASVASYVILFLIVRYAKLGLSNIGLAGSNIKSGLLWGLIGAVIVFAVMGIVYLVSPSTFLDARYNQDTRSLIGALVLSLPIYTVIIEEIIFRGVMPALLMRSTSVQLAFVLSSILFGLWHILPSLQMKSVSIFGGALFVPRPVVIGSSIVAPFVVGLLLSFMAYKSKSIIAPMIVHWSINASGMALAFLAWDRV